MEKRIELWVSPTGNVAVYRGSTFIPTEQLTEEERLFVLNRVCDELKGKDLDVEIKKYTEEKYHETFGNGQGTLDEFDWDDIAQTIEETAHHFANWQKEQQPHWKPSEEQIEALKCAVMDIAKFSKRGGRQVELENEPYYNALHSLYEQLLKLGVKEEPEYYQHFDPDC